MTNDVDATPGAPMPITEQLAEAFQLGSVLAEIRTSLLGVNKTVDKIESTVVEQGKSFTTMQLTQAQQGAIIAGLVPRVEKLEASPHDHSDLATKAELGEVKQEVANARLTWPKVGLLVTGAGGLLTLAVFADRVIPG
jgi:hypothetical protein